MYGCGIYSIISLQVFTRVFLFFGVFLHAVNAVYNVMYNYTYIHVCFIPGGIPD